MANMSYCRFQNTSSDLDDCLSAIRNREKLSEDEERAFRSMMSEISDFLADEDLLDPTEGCIDSERVDDLISECNESDEF